MAARIDVNGDFNDINVDIPVQGGVSWYSALGLQYRINTELGAHLRRPDYGINLLPLIDGPLDLTRLRLLVTASLKGLYKLVGLRVYPESHDTAIIEIGIETIPGEVGIRTRRFSLQFSVEFGTRLYV